MIDQKTEKRTPFGELYDDLPDNMEGLDEVIEDLKDELAGSVDNPEVVERQDEVRSTVSRCCIDACLLHIVLDWISFTVGSLFFFLPLRRFVATKSRPDPN